MKRQKHPQGVFYKKIVRILENSVKTLEDYNFIKKETGAVNLAKFLRTSILVNICKYQFLKTSTFTDSYP